MLTNIDTKLLEERSVRYYNNRHEIHLLLSDDDNMKIILLNK